MQPPGTVGGSAGGGRGELLRAIKEELTAGGLEVHGFDSDGIPTHIEVTSPGAPDRGMVSIGWDGLLIWERQCPVGALTRPAGSPESRCASFMADSPRQDVNPGE